MLEKSSIFMMLLLAAASLVIISGTQDQLNLVVEYGQSQAQPLQKGSQILGQQPQQQQQPSAQSN